MELQLVKIKGLENGKNQNRVMEKIKMNNNQTKCVNAYITSSSSIFMQISGTENILLSAKGFTYQLNAVLRANVMLDSTTEHYLTLLDSAFENYQTTEEIITYRICNYLEMYRYICNDRYVDCGYMSTSLKKNTLDKFLGAPALGYFPAIMEITVPSGSNILFVDCLEELENDTYESEVLFKRRSLFEILENKKCSFSSISNDWEIMKSEFTETVFLKLRFMKYLQ